MNKFLAVPVLVLLVASFAGGCKQGEGDRCQVRADCADGLTCNQGRNPPVCQAEGNAGGIDALPPVDAPVDAAVDAAPDAPDAM